MFIDFFSLCIHISGLPLSPLPSDNEDPVCWGTVIEHSANWLGFEFEFLYWMN